MDIRDTERIANELLTAHGLTALGWRFEFDRSTRRMGICRFTRKLIQVSKPLAELNTEETMRDTILHEIAHALAGVRAAHGMIWKLTARAIGARPETCQKLSSVVQVQTAWQAVCQDCGIKVSRTRKPNLARAYWHGECRYKANKGKVVWHFQGESVSGV